jgi:hypothetical protein
MEFNVDIAMVKHMVDLDFLTCVAKAWQTRMWTLELYKALEHQQPKHKPNPSIYGPSTQARCINL